MKMEEEDDMLAYINKVKALADQLNGADVTISDRDIVMMLLESLPPSYEYLIVAMESSPIQELTLDYVTSRLLHELSRRKENESRGDGAAFYAKQAKGASNGSNNKRACYYCGKKDHIAKYCFKKKNNEKESANTTKVSVDGNEYAFMASDAVAIANVNDGHERGPEYAFVTSHMSTHGSVSD